MYIYTGAQEALERAGGRRQKHARGEGETVVEVIECPKRLKFLGNTQTQDSELVSPIRLFGGWLGFCDWEVEC